MTTQMTAAEMFEYLAGGRGVVTERPFRHRTEQIVDAPVGFTLRSPSGWVRWTQLSRILLGNGVFGWYRLHGAVGGRASRHVRDAAQLILEEAPAP